jgi:hypothetical protein
MCGDGRVPAVRRFFYSFTSKLLFQKRVPWVTLYANGGVNDAVFRLGVGQRLVVAPFFAVVLVIPWQPGSVAGTPGMLPELSPELPFVWRGCLRPGKC